MNQFGAQPLNDPPLLADSDIGVFSDYKKEQNVEETLIDGASDPTNEDGTISNARQKSGAGFNFSNNNYRRYISQEGGSCYSGGQPNSSVSRPRTRGQIMRTQGELSSQMGRETQSSYHEQSVQMGVTRFKHEAKDGHRMQKYNRNVKMGKLIDNESQAKQQPPRSKTNQGPRNARRVCTFENYSHENDRPDMAMAQASVGAPENPQM